VAGVGAGNGFRAGHKAEFRRRLGSGYDRWAALSDMPASDRTPEEEGEYCLLQWQPDYSPAGDPAGHALALWSTRPPGAAINLAGSSGATARRRTCSAPPHGSAAP
jgi:proline iminopeptidase